jgi:hypothetical protein
MPVPGPVPGPVPCEFVRQFESLSIHSKVLTYLVPSQVPSQGQYLQRVNYEDLQSTVRSEY